MTSRSPKKEGARVRIVGVGQACAGDDGVGLEVLRWLSSHRAIHSAAIEPISISEPSALLSLRSDRTPLVIVDAVLGEPAGALLEATEAELGLSWASVSSHGVSVTEALALSRQLIPVPERAPVLVIGIRIAAPRELRIGLSEEVAAAVPRAAQRALACAQRLQQGGGSKRAVT